MVLSYPLLELLLHLSIFPSGTSLFSPLFGRLYPRLGRDSYTFPVKTKTLVQLLFLFDVTIHHMFQALCSTKMICMVHSNLQSKMSVACELKNTMKLTIFHYNATIRFIQGIIFVFMESSPTKNRCSHILFWSLIFLLNIHLHLSIQVLHVHIGSMHNSVKTST